MRKRLWHCIRPLGKPLSRVGITIVCASQFTANLLLCHSRALTLSVPPRRVLWGFVLFPASSPTSARRERGEPPAHPAERGSSPGREGGREAGREAQRWLISPAWIILLRSACAVVALTIPSKMQMNYARIAELAARAV